MRMQLQGTTACGVVPPNQSMLLQIGLLCRSFHVLLALWTRSAIVSDSARSDLPAHCWNSRMWFHRLTSWSLHNVLAIRCALKPWYDSWFLLPNQLFTCIAFGWSLCQMRSVEDVFQWSLFGWALPLTTMLRAEQLMSRFGKLSWVYEEAACISVLTEQVMPTCFPDVRHEIVRLSALVATRTTARGVVPPNRSQLLRTGWLCRWPQVLLAFMNTFSPRIRFRQTKPSSTLLT